MKLKHLKYDELFTLKDSCCQYILMYRQNKMSFCTEPVTRVVHIFDNDTEINPLNQVDKILPVHCENNACQIRRVSIEKN